MICPKSYLACYPQRLDHRIIFVFKPNLVYKGIYFDFGKLWIQQMKPTKIRTDIEDVTLSNITI